MKSYYKEIQPTETHIKFIVHLIFKIIIFLSSFKILYDPFRHRSSLYYILFNGRDRLRASGGVFVVKRSLIHSDSVVGKQSRSRLDIYFKLMLLVSYSMFKLINYKECKCYTMGVGFIVGVCGRRCLPLEHFGLGGCSTLTVLSTLRNPQECWVRLQVSPRTLLSYRWVVIGV